MPLASVCGAEIHYQIVGSGTPLLMLLPQSTGPTGRAATIDALAQCHSVIVYDQRGTGGSAPSNGDVSMDAQAMDAIGLLDALNLERAHLFCHSTGCGIGLTMAARQASRVSTLVLVNPWSHADAHLCVMQRLRIAAARALDPRSYAQFNSALLFPPEFRRAHDSGFSRLAANAVSAPQNADEIERRLEAILAFDARGLLPTIDKPTLVITARDDQLMPSWFSVEISEALKASVLVEFDSGGHMLPETRSSELVEAVLGHLAGVDTQN